MTSERNFFEGVIINCIIFVLTEDLLRNENVSLYGLVLFVFPYFVFEADADFCTLQKKSKTSKQHSETNVFERFNIFDILIFLILLIFLKRVTKFKRKQYAG